MSHAPHFQNAALGFELGASKRPSGKRQAASVAVIEWSLQAHLQGGKQYAAQISADK